MGLNNYTVPAIFSLLMVWSFREYVRTAGVLITLSIYYVFSCLSLVIYIAAHLYFGSGLQREFPDLFGRNEFIASAVIGFINLLFFKTIHLIKKRMI
ncbi:hypothetical protein GKQ23_15540 [Erwinia sp. E602]|uniref:hypothetical protein n=1 Tax=Erwinia sp. E602 TaxID=2675378 RepID=UPI001BAC575E|nr:hypothetical protein [Erwinia sp. E602]QUG76327.1 hypothetical protein GKQ23_15540 [Erwinia sp. E602]